MIVLFLVISFFRRFATVDVWRFISSMQTIIGLGITRSKPNKIFKQWVVFFVVARNGKERMVYKWFRFWMCLCSNMKFLRFFLFPLVISTRIHSLFCVHYFRWLQMFGVILLLARIGTFSFFCLNIFKKKDSIAEPKYLFCFHHSLAFLRCFQCGLLGIMVQKVVNERWRAIAEDLMMPKFTVHKQTQTKKFFFITTYMNDTGSEREKLCE